MQIKFFWVWAAINEKSDNTFFLIEDWINNLQVDCSWWKSLARQVKFNNIKFNNLFITHKHTDHILWFFHLIRVYKKLFLDEFNIYCSSDVKNTIINISNNLWWKNKEIFELNTINFNIIDKISEVNIWDFILKPINLNSKKIEQFWFLLEYKWKKFLYFWDEAVWVLKRDDLHNYFWVDYLILEALCLESMTLKSWWKIDNNKLFHISSKDAWKIANYLKVKNLIIVHTMDIVFDNIKNLMIKEIKSEFSWNIFIPKAWDIINIE